MTRPLQIDLSMTPASLFRPTGPRFHLLFGRTAPQDRAPVQRPAPWTSIPVPVLAPDLFGWAVVYALHARACIERGRLWQAEHYVGAVRDLALTLACLQHGLPAAQARGYDDLPADVLVHLRDTHVGGHEPYALRAALAASAHAMAHLATAAGLPNSHTVAERLEGGGLTPGAT